MLELALGRQAGTLRRMLCLGAHCDDIEIGCGGTVLRLLGEHPGLEVHWVVLSSDAVRAAEARQSADLFLAHAGARTVTIHDFRNGFFPYVGASIKEYFERLKGEVAPDLILTHNRHDLHQDHRVVSELTWNTFRDHLILEYEIPKYDCDLGRPNLFVPLAEAVCRRKIDHLLLCFATQKNKHWFTRETFQALLRLRGVECNSPSGYAEAFYSHKLLV